MKYTRHFAILLLVILSISVAGLPTVLADSGLVQFEKNFYQAIEDSTLAWGEASAAAEAAELPDGCTSAHLATITSQAEDDFIVAEFSAFVSAPFLGGFQLDGATELDGDWQWVTGEDFSQFTNWNLAVPEPNDNVTTLGVEDGEEQYLHYPFATGGWNDTFADWEPIDGYIIEFECGNLPPIAEDFTIELNEDEVEDFNFLDHASDPNDDVLTVVIDTQPAVGTLTVNDDGTASFVPDAEWSGTTSFTYHVNDGEFDSNIATVWIIVYPVNDPPNCEALAANISTIWSPNHEMVSVSIDESSVSDIDSTIFEITLTDITHDEAINGLGDGNTDPDWDLEAGTIRAERSGTGNGRTYTISVNVNDTDWIDTFEDLEGLFESTPEPIDGGDCNGAVEVFVPHDMRNDKDSTAEEEILAVCHMPPGNTDNATTIYVGSQSAVDAHLAHRDILGVCAEPAVKANENAHSNNPNANPNAAQAGNNGKGSENSNSNANGNNSNSASSKGNSNGKGNGKGNK